MCAFCWFLLLMLELLFEIRLESERYGGHLLSHIVLQ